MGTALAVPQQQSIEVAARSGATIHSTDRCPRCSGLMVAEWCQDRSDYTAQRCVQCGEVIDPVILQNRRQYEMTEAQRALSTPRRGLSAR
jgi:hypothetical protein